MQYLLSAIIAAVVSAGSFFGLGHEVTIMPEVQKAIEVYVDKSMEAPTFGTTLPIAGQTFNLAGSGVSQTATSITLASLTVTQTGQKIIDSDLSDTFYITLEPGNPSKQEIVSCTTVVQNANNSATLSGCSRGLSPITPYTASTTLRFSHGGGTQVIFSNPPQFYNEFAALQNTQSITGQWTFDDNDLFRPRVDADTDTACATCFVSLGQLSRQAVSGASNASETVKGIVELATGAEASIGASVGGTAARLAIGANLATSSPFTAANLIPVTRVTDGKLSPYFIATTSADYYIFGNLQTSSSTQTGNTNILGTSNFSATSTFATSTKELGVKQIWNHVAGTPITLSSNVPQAVTFATSSGQVFLSDGDNSTTTDFQGFAVSSAASVGSSILVQTSGIVTGFSGLTAGRRYYVQDTGSGGSIGTSVGTSEVYVGIALTASDLLIDRPQGWQYLGSQTLTCSASADTVINQPLARFAIVAGSASESGSGSSGSHQSTIAKVGVTSDAWTDYSNLGAATVNILTSTWTSTSSIRMAYGGNSNSCSATAYYYR